MSMDKPEPAYKASADCPWVSHQCGFIYMLYLRFFISFLKETSLKWFMSLVADVAKVVFLIHLIVLEVLV